MADYLKSILNAFHDLLFVFTPDGIIEDYLTTNKVDELIQPKEVFLGKHHRDVLPARVSDQLERAFKQLNRGEGQYKFDYSINLRGDVYWYEAILTKAEHEGDTRYLAAVRNITKRKNYEILLRSVLNTSPAGIMVLRAVRSPDGTITDFKITEMNESTEELTGVTEKELKGQLITSVVDDHEKDKILKRFKSVVETGKPVDFYYQHIDEHNNVSWYHSKVAKYRDGVVSTFMDISEQKKNEEDLEKANQELKELNRQKDKLFSVISHDLKNSVSGILGVFDLILEDYETLSKEDLLEYLELLNNRAKSTAELLEDLLLWSKNQFQKIDLNPEKLNLAAITNTVFDSTLSLADDKGISLKNRVPDQVSIVADTNIVKTVLRNLVANGIKFSHPGGEVIVDAKQTGDDVEISVTDRGVGIDKETLEKILDGETNFTTEGTRGESGSGLGVDLCQNFVELHGGTLRVKSEPGKGSTFLFTLPHSARDL